MKYSRIFTAIETFIDLTTSNIIFLYWLFFPCWVKRFLVCIFSRCGFLARRAPIILLGCLLISGCAGPIKYISADGTEVETSEEVARMMAIRDMDAARSKALNDSLIAAKGDAATTIAIMALAMRPQQAIERGRDWAEKVGSLSGIIHDGLALAFLWHGGDMFGNRSSTDRSPSLSIANSPGANILWESDNNMNPAYNLSNGEGSMNLDFSQSPGYTPTTNTNNNNNYDSHSQEDQQIGLLQ